MFFSQWKQLLTKVSGVNLAFIAFEATNTAVIREMSNSWLAIPTVTLQLIDQSENVDLTKIALRRRKDTYNA